MKTITDDDVLFNIQQVATMIGVVPATIRNWEKSGIFVPRRTKSNYRVFDFNDIDMLKRIKQYSIDDKIGSRAIKMLVGPHFVEPDDNIHYSKRLLSGKWRENRERLGLTLEEVSARTGISASYLSKIENAQVSISLSMLQKLAAFYNQSILHYFDTGFTETRVIKRGTGDPIEVGIEGVRIESLIAAKEHMLYPVLYHVDPGCGNPETHTHIGEEFLYVLKGKIEIDLRESEHYVLKSGDSMFFNSAEMHSWYNSGNKTAEIIWVHCPISR